MKPRYMVQALVFFLVSICTISVLHAAGDQQVQLIPSQSDVSANTSFHVTVRYNVSDNDNTLTGIGLRFYYDSTKMNFNSFSNVYGTPLAIDTEPQNDVENGDNDSATDRFLGIAWTDCGGNWPNQALPLDIAHMNFTVKGDAVLGTSPVNVTYTSKASGYNFAPINTLINISEQIIPPRPPGNLALTIQSPGVVTLQWDKSLDDPYLQSYKVYYYTAAGNTDSLNPEDYASTYTLLGGDPIVITPDGPKSITIGRDNTQITLYALNRIRDYYFVVKAVDVRGLEGIPTLEISIVKLTVSKVGGGMGAVTSLPLGIPNINCGSTCASHFVGGAMVTLTATPDPENVFLGWSDGCSGSALCVITMNTSKSVTAAFNEYIPLTANSGSNQVAFNNVTLDGSSSKGNIISWEWTLIHQTNPAYSRTAAGQKPNLDNLAAGFYNVRLTVSDGASTNTSTSVLAVAGPWDVNNDGKTGLAEVLYILQKMSGTR